MTKKQNSVELDAYACILHAAQSGVTFKVYVKKIEDYGSKRLRMVTGVKE
jgi:hypothetical protein